MTRKEAVDSANFPAAIIDGGCWGPIWMAHFWVTDIGPDLSLWRHPRLDMYRVDINHDCRIEKYLLGNIDLVVRGC